METDDIGGEIDQLQRTRRRTKNVTLQSKQYSIWSNGLFIVWMKSSYSL